jgi:exodeoxyribonuclease V gamma subunit
VELELWIRHLALSASEHGSTSVLVRRAGDGAKVEIVRMEPLPSAEAKEELSRLLSIFDLGQRQPLCFFPRSARAFAQKLVDGEELDKALRVAETEFTGNRELSEWADAYFSRLFPGPEALGPEYAKPSFPELAIGIYVPFLERAERETLS